MNYLSSLVTAPTWIKTYNDGFGIGHYNVRLSNLKPNLQNQFQSIKSTALGAFAFLQGVYACDEYPDQTYLKEDVGNVCRITRKCGSACVEGASKVTNKIFTCREHCNADFNVTKFPEAYVVIQKYDGGNIVLECDNFIGMNDTFAKCVSGVLNQASTEQSVICRENTIYRALGTAIGIAVGIGFISCAAYVGWRILVHKNTNVDEEQADNQNQVELDSVEEILQGTADE